jgi:histidine-containing phosphotransfer protein
MQMVKDSCAPGFIAEIITLFCNQGKRIIDELAKML